MAAYDDDDDDIIRPDSISSGDRVQSSGLSAKASPDESSASFMDALGEAFSTTRNRIEQYTSNPGSMPGLDDSSFYSQADRFAVTEALAKAGIPPIESPAGLIQLADGWLQAQERLRVQDDTVALAVAQLQGERDLLVHLAPVVQELRLREHELERLKLQQATATQQFIGQADTSIAQQRAEREQLKLDEERLQAEVARLNADVVRAQKEKDRFITQMETDFAKRQAELAGELAAKRREFDHKTDVYDDDLREKRAEIEKMRKEADLRRFQRSTWIYAHKGLLSAIGAVVLVVAALLVVISVLI